MGVCKHNYSSREFTVPSISVQIAIATHCPLRCVGITASVFFCFWEHIITVIDIKWSRNNLAICNYLYNSWCITLYDIERTMDRAPIGTNQWCKNCVDILENEWSVEDQSNVHTEWVADALQLMKINDRVWIFKIWTQTRR